MAFDLRTPEYRTERRPRISKRTVLGLAGFIAVLIFAAGFFLWSAISQKFVTGKKMADQSSGLFGQDSASESPTSSLPQAEWKFNPGPISMELIKNNGCVADGFLSNYGGNSTEIAAMIDRSQCVYLHRALETWLKPPSFNQAVAIMQKVNKQPVVYGMFLAEALSTFRRYDDPNDDHNYDMKKMCRDGTDGRWGNDTCIASVEKPEYRRYLKSITHRAMDIGIQSFLFGQVQLQDEQPNYENTAIKEVVADMRSYAKKKNMQIIIGAQTNSITDASYLHLFDYIEGGVGINAAGQVENGPCLSKFKSCWGLLWNDQFKAKANNVLVNLDWSGLTWDDMGIFSRMPQDDRIATLKSLYQKFTSQGVGFMMPFLTVINQDNGGCWGPNKNFYSPSNKYRCKDEAAINAIMNKAVADAGPKSTKQ
jgi:hypothetical protein